MNEHPEFDIVEVTRKIGINMLNSVEITIQEAAWYLLREPMSKCSTVVTTIPTMWPTDRQRIQKTQKELDKLGVGDDSTNIWRENWFDKYEKRHEDLEDVTLAQFVAHYTIQADGTYAKRKKQPIIRYRNFDMAQDLNEYKREMVSLHFPFRNEDAEILSELKFIQIYNENEDVILNCRSEFESDLDIQKTIEICRNLYRDDINLSNKVVQDAANRCPEPDPYQHLFQNTNSEMNDDIRLAVLNKLGPIAKKKNNQTSHANFCDFMRMSNNTQSELLLHVISHLLSLVENPHQIFLTGPAGCGKTFVIRLIMEKYNRFTNTDGICDAYIACALTGKAAVAIDGTTVQIAFKITLSKLLPLSTEVAHQYRALFKFIKVIIIDEVSMISAELLGHIDSRLKQITGNFGTNFGGLDMILIGDLRQLPPVRATPIYKQRKQKIVGPILWRSLKFYALEEVMRQSNQLFSSIVTKIGNGEQLESHELELIQTRFCTVDEANTYCPRGIRLYNTNHAVETYNKTILDDSLEKHTSIAKDIYVERTSIEQQAFVRHKLHKMSIIDTGGLPYETIFVQGIYYMITTNINVSDGLANGAVGKLVHIERDDN